MPPTSAAPARPRTYLRAPDRRAQLLDTAAGIVGREGLPALTMAGLASDAGVSRQWVHEHFADLTGLLRALLVDRFTALEESIDAAAPSSTGPELAVLAARKIFELPGADRRILGAVVHGSARQRPELAAVDLELREKVFKRWVPILSRTNEGGPLERSIVWTFLTAIFGLADQIERDSLHADQAIGILRRLLGAFAKEDRHAY